MWSLKILHSDFWHFSKQKFDKCSLSSNSVIETIMIVLICISFSTSNPLFWNHHRSFATSDNSFFDRFFRFNRQLTHDDVIELTLTLDLLIKCAINVLDLSTCQTGNQTQLNCTSHGIQISFLKMIMVSVLPHNHFVTSMAIRKHSMIVSFLVTTRKSATLLCVTPFSQLSLNAPRHMMSIWQIIVKGFI